MKKIVGTIAAMALVASAAFAEVGIGSWGRGIWTPAQYDSTTEKVNSWEGVSWGGDTVRTGISIHGESENVGFNIDMNADGNNASIGDTAYFWAKPWSFLEMKIGKVQDDTGRGNVAYGIFDWIRMGFGCTGEDVTFTRFGNGSGAQGNGAIIKLTPVENLWIIAAFDVQDKDEARLTYGQHAQYGVGYNINNVGLIRAQIIGAPNAKNYEGDTICNGAIEAAFDLTAVENLRLTVGAKIPLGMKAVDMDDDGVVSNQVKIAAGADYSMSALTLHALVVALLPNKVTVTESGVDVYAEKGFKLSVGIGADYDLGNGIALTGDIRFQTKQELKAGMGDYSVTTALDGGDLAFLVGAKKNLSNGFVGIGFQGEIANLDKYSDKFNWYVPVAISAWF